MDEDPPTPGPPTVSLSWLRDGTDRLVAAVAALTDEELTRPSLLPGWDRTTLLAHVAQNARALSNLLRWARTGVETPMYPDRDARASGIAELAAQPVAAIRAALLDSDAELRRDLAELPAASWTATVRTFQGRPVPASEVPWMRNREVWVHAVDLHSGLRFADMPADVLAALLDDAASLMSGRPEAVAVTARATDAGREWSFGPPATPAAQSGPAQVTGELADVCAWALGRRGAPGVRAEHSWPDLPAWL